MKLLIGIDTGTHTGIAIWDGETLRVDCTTISKAMLEVLRLATLHEIIVLYEDATQRKWFGQTGRERLKGAGSVERDSKIWRDFLKENGIKNKAIAPKDNRTKLTAQQFKLLTGYKGTTNEHSRDAAMLVYKRNFKLLDYAL